jgi:hypothetical protein
MRFVFVLLFTVALGACSTALPKQRSDFAIQTDKWIGRSGDDLISKYGVPTETFALEAGGKMYEYYKAQLVPGNRYTSSRTTILNKQKRYSDNMSPPDTSDLRQRRQSAAKKALAPCEVQFVISSANVIESWTTEGDDCEE